jgi:hypothetical protein
MTKAELFRKLMLLPAHIETDFATEAGITEVTDTELEDFAARCAINRYQGIDVGERPRLLVLLPRGVRSIAGVDKELDAMFEELRATEATLGRLRDASFGFALGPGAVRSTAWEVLGENADR